MHRTHARTILKPTADAVEVESTETLETTHLDANFVVLKTDGALGIVNAILFCRFVRKDAGSTHGTL